MAASVTDIISLDEMKTELRLPTDIDDHDGMITSQMNAAASFLSRYISVPLIDVTETVHGTPQKSDKPIPIRARALKEVSEIRYWSENGSLRTAPDETVDTNDLGRIDSKDEPWNLVYPPAAGWPDRLDGSVFELDVVRGIDFDPTDHPETQALKQALVLLVRQLYDGFHEFTATNAVMALIAPWRRFD